MPYARNETIADRIKRAGLPETHDIHWSENRKAEVVEAVHNELVDFEEVRECYLLSHREFRSWEEEVGKKELEDA